MQSQANSCRAERGESVAAYIEFLYRAMVEFWQAMETSQKVLFSAKIRKDTCITQRMEYIVP